VAALGAAGSVAAAAVQAPRAQAPKALMIFLFRESTQNFLPFAE
jgi:hypothetical protein